MHPSAGRTKLTLVLSQFPGRPSVEISLEDGTVSRLSLLLPQLGDDDRTVALAQALGQAAAALENAGNNAAASEVYRSLLQVLEATTRILDRAVCLRALGLTLKRAGRLEQAQAPYEQALDLLRSPSHSFPDDDARTIELAGVLLNLTILAQARDKPDDRLKYGVWARHAVGDVEGPRADQIRKELDHLGFAVPR
jgi:tetratricopeptide (TPR) repeat protein